jgi:DNA-binding transcriptional regulator YhcF (GntR family)
MPRTTIAPYSKIVAELRSRIERGTLAPGDRVPSTREIMRRWGVAMATATKVLTALRQEGFVRTRPGVGSVVSGERRSRGRGRATSRRTSASAAELESPRPRAEPIEPLARERITQAAIAVADAEGLSALSMRRLAVELGVATMTLYRHVADKDELLLFMLDAACRELSFPQAAPSGWRARVELAVRLMWQGFCRHPWLAPALSLTRPQLIQSGLVYTDWVLRELERAGLSDSDTLTAHLTLFNYVRGTAMNIELEKEAEAATGLSSEEWLNRQEPDFRALIAEGHFSALARMVARPYEFDLDQLFEFGLQRLLDGIALRVEHVQSAR